MFKRLFPASRFLFHTHTLVLALYRNAIHLNNSFIDQLEIVSIVLLCESGITSVVMWVRYH